MDWSKLLKRARTLTDALMVTHLARELVFQAGAFAPGLHILAKGIVVRGGYVAGRPQPVALARSGDIIGIEAWLSDDIPCYRGFARALTNVEALFVPSEPWKEAMAEPRFLGLALAQVAEQVLAEETLLQHRGQPESALAWLIWRWGELEDGWHHLPTSSSFIATLLGFSRNTVREALAHLSELGIVEFDNGEIRGDGEGLHALLEGELTASPR
jgi:CRP-like cAMP-binding protein